MYTSAACVTVTCALQDNECGNYCDGGSGSPGVPEPPAWSPGRRKRTTVRKDGGVLVAAGGGRDNIEVGPVAVEPTDDGVAAVVTVVVQLPGFGEPDDARAETQAPTHRLALGSALSLMSRIYPAASKPFLIRRRTSHGLP